MCIPGCDRVIWTSARNWFSTVLLTLQYIEITNQKDDDQNKHYAYIDYACTENYQMLQHVSMKWFTLLLHCCIDLKGTAKWMLIKLIMAFLAVIFEYYKSILISLSFHMF